jgi:hypothetical protein
MNLYFVGDAFFFQMQCVYDESLYTQLYIYPAPSTRKFSKKNFLETSRDILSKSSTTSRAKTFAPYCICKTKTLRKIFNMIGTDIVMVVVHFEYNKSH